MELSGKSNISPKIWGPFFWKTFHLSTLGYPEIPNELDIKAYESFYKSFMKILPCDKCSFESQKMLESIINDGELTKALKSRESLVNWGYFFHKAVNDKNYVKSIELDTFKEEMANLISGNIKNSENKSDEMYLLFFIFFIILVVISYFVFTRYMKHNP